MRRVIFAMRDLAVRAPYRKGFRRAYVADEFVGATALRGVERPPHIHAACPVLGDEQASLLKIFLHVPARMNLNSREMVDVREKERIFGDGSHGVHSRESVARGPRRMQSETR